MTVNCIFYSGQNKLGLCNLVLARLQEQSQHFKRLSLDYVILKRYAKTEIRA